MRHLLPDWAFVLIICRIKLYRNTASVSIVFKLLNYLAHISHLFFPMDSLIICDSTDKIFLYASGFIWLPLSVTSVQSTEPGPEVAMHAAVMMLSPECFTGKELCSALSLLLCIFLCSCCWWKSCRMQVWCIFVLPSINLLPVVNYDPWNLEIV